MLIEGNESKLLFKFVLSLAVLCIRNVFECFVELVLVLDYFVDCHLDSLVLFVLKFLLLL